MELWLWIFEYCRSMRTVFKELIIPVLAAVMAVISNSAAQTKQPVVSNISYSGNEYFSSSQLLNISVLKPGSTFSDDQFELDMKNLIKNYEQNGYFDCT